jgi:hypothetical protein
VGVRLRADSALGAQGQSAYRGCLIKKERFSFVDIYKHMV